MVEVVTGVLVEVEVVVGPLPNYSKLKQGDIGKITAMDLKDLLKEQEVGSGMDVEFEGGIEGDRLLLETVEGLPCRPDVSELVCRHHLGVLMVARLNLDHLAPLRNAVIEVARHQHVVVSQHVRARARIERKQLGTDFVELRIALLDVLLLALMRCQMRGKKADGAVQQTQ